MSGYFLRNSVVYYGELENTSLPNLSMRCCSIKPLGLYLLAHL